MADRVALRLLFRQRRRGRSAEIALDALDALDALGAFHPAQLGHRDAEPAAHLPLAVPGLFA
jgi:hypothetical protein